VRTGLVLKRGGRFQKRREESPLVSSSGRGARGDDPVWEIKGGEDKIQQRGKENATSARRLKRKGKTLERYILLLNRARRQKAGKGGGGRTGANFIPSREDRPNSTNISEHRQPSGTGGRFSPREKKRRGGMT